MLFLVALILELRRGYWDGGCGAVPTRFSQKHALMSAQPLCTHEDFRTNLCVKIIHVVDSQNVAARLHTFDLTDSFGKKYGKPASQDWRLEQNWASELSVALLLVKPVLNHC